MPRQSQPCLTRYRSPHHEKPIARADGALEWSAQPDGTAGAERPPVVCTHLADCALYPKLRLQATRDFWTGKYCHSDPSKCARMKLSLEGKPVPHALLPSGQTLTISR